MATLYAAAYPASQDAPSAAQVIAGTVPNGFHANDASAPETDQTDYAGPTITGLAEGTLYRLAAVWDDGAGSVSNLAISAPFSTTGTYTVGPIVLETSSDIVVGSVEFSSNRYGVSVELDNADGGPIANATGILAVWWDTPLPTGDPVRVVANQTTNADGVLSVDLSGWTSLSDGDEGYLLLYQLDTGDHRDSLTFASKLEVELL